MSPSSPYDKAKAKGTSPGPKSPGNSGKPSPWDSAVPKKSPKEHREARPEPETPPYWGEQRPLNPARDLALKLLFEAAKPMAPGLDHYLDQAADRGVSQADLRLARHLAFGVLQKKAALLELLNGYLREPIVDKPGVELSLLLGLEQFLFTERLPAHAIVDETVRLVEAQRGGDKLKRLANAVLRKASTEVEALKERFEELPWEARTNATEMLRELTRAAYPDPREEEAFWLSCNERAPLCLRLRGFTRAEALERLQQECPQLPWGELEDHDQHPELLDSLVMPAHFGAVTASAFFQSGGATVEDLGAQIAATLGAPPDSARRILDLCASPGGKTSHWADLRPQARFTATDVTASKLKRLRETLNRLGVLSRVDIMLAEEMLAAAAPQSYDAILVDAPCSGLGTLRRHPEIRLRRNRENILHMQEMQLRLLLQVAPLLRVGGSLTFIVCTITKEETEDVCTVFAERHPEFVPVEPIALGLNPEPYRLEESHTFRIDPHVHGHDGFFVARWEKRGE